jgi:hypothetical protein
MRRKRTTVASRIEFIDPSDCGSTVGYSITRKDLVRVSAEIYLSDCNRKIEWYFSGERPESIQKIDSAIEILQEFRQKYVDAVKKKSRKS